MKTNIQKLVSDLVRRKLSGDEVGPWHIEGVAVSARLIAPHKLPADAIATRYFFEEPDEQWAVRTTIVRRGGHIWRCSIEGFDDLGHDRTEDQICVLFADWLQAA